MQFSVPLDQGSDILKDDGDVPRNSGTLLDLMSVDVANLLAAAESSFPRHGVRDTGGTGVLLNTFDILVQAQAIDAKLATWPAFVPVDWVPVRISIDSVPKGVVEAGFYGDTCDIYPDIMVCSTWNDWRVARLMVLGLIIQIGHQDSMNKAIQAIQDLVDGICASIPFSLGDRTQPEALYEAQLHYPNVPGKPMSKDHQKTASAYGGWYLFAPLMETTRIWTYLREGQREWLGGQLMRLARMYDVKTSP